MSEDNRVQLEAFPRDAAPLFSIPEKLEAFHRRGGFTDLEWIEGRAADGSELVVLLGVPAKEAP